MAIREHRRTLGRNLRSYRERAGWAQEKLAEKAGLSAKFLGEVERATVNISLDALARIASVLNVRLADLVAGV